jgi:hypothetical protein
MKAHMPAAHIVQPNRRAVRAACAKELEAEETDVMRRFMKLAIQAMDESGIALEKIKEASTKFTDLAGERDKDEIFWFHIDRNVIDELGFQFDRENYEEVDR